MVRWTESYVPRNRTLYQTTIPTLNTDLLVVEILASMEYVLFVTILDLHTDVPFVAIQVLNVALPQIKTQILHQHARGLAFQPPSSPNKTLLRNIQRVIKGTIVGVYFPN